MEVRRPSASTRHRAFHRSIGVQATLWILASAFSFLTVLLSTIVGHESLGLSEESSLAVAMLIAIAMNFLICRYAVFGTGRQPFRRQATSFALTIGAFRTGEFLAFLFFHSLLGLAYQPVLVGIQATAFLLKFLVMRARVFRTTDNS